MNKRIKSLALGGAVAGLLSFGLVGCSSDSGDVTLTLATVNNGQMKDMEGLKGEFEAANPGIKVNFQVMEEGDLRAAVTSDVANAAGQYDIVTIGAYEVPQWVLYGRLFSSLLPVAECVGGGTRLLVVVCSRFTGSALWAQVKYGIWPLGEGAMEERPRRDEARRGEALPLRARLGRSVTGPAHVGLGCHNSMTGSL